MRVQWQINTLTLFSAFFLSTLFFTSTNAARLCTTECRLMKPVCPSGEAPSGVAGCWGCCMPISTFKPKPKPVEPPTPTPSSTPEPIFCTDQCRVTEPVCLAGEKATGSEGCWGCCQPVG
ncbi:hypothetical protein CPB83DRAFT_852091 [Crepidotus variabilis]|uniref:Uncharacterized protein n=1 Tax=Crepidotus variabilis TaxID=179855 RepID=A0A9P6EIT7_9AGAR|nr:hypothetical protein CPB83DRAFT_852091 [Crepidotus variabilis]